MEEKGSRALVSDYETSVHGKYWVGRKLRVFCCSGETVRVILRVGFLEPVILSLSIDLGCCKTCRGVVFVKRWFAERELAFSLQSDP